MTHPLDHDGDGRKGGSLPRRGRPKKVKDNALQDETKTETETKGALTVKVAGVIHDGEGGFFPVGHKFDAADETAAEALKAKGFAE